MDCGIFSDNIIRPVVFDYRSSEASVRPSDDAASVSLQYCVFFFMTGMLLQVVSLDSRKNP